MRTGGTRAKTGDQLDEQLENIAATVESGIGETSGSVSFSALKENTDEVLGIFHDVLTAPEFRQDKIDLVKIAAAQRHRAPQRRRGRHRRARVHRHSSTAATRPTAGAWNTPPGPHRARRPGGLLPALLLPGQHPAGRVRRFRRRRDEGQTREDCSAAGTSSSRRCRPFPRCRQSPRRASSWPRSPTSRRPSSPWATWAASCATRTTRRSK